LNEALFLIRDLCGELLAGRRAEVVDSIVADGWPRPMVEAGLDRHAITWNAVELVRAYQAELAAADLSHPPPGIPDEVLHIWPKLPGAGVTPLLYGLAMGVPRQRIRPSSRGMNFAEIFASIAALHVPRRILLDDQSSIDSEVVIVSGSDQTLAAVGLEMSNTGGTGRLVGYGHRVSFAVVEAGSNVADRVAEDIVMWKQYGCFSCRAVIVVGEPEAADAHARKLAEAIGGCERRWGATEIDPANAAQRAQALGLAEFSVPIHRAEIGWVERRKGLPDGSWIAPHVVSVHHANSIDDVGFDVPANQMQAIAIAGSPTFVRAMNERAEQLGATRVCRVGELQAPPAAWPHDGRPNVLGWLQDSR
jgi:hypothetical protein